MGFMTETSNPAYKVNGKGFCDSAQWIPWRRKA